MIKVTNTFAQYYNDNNILLERELIEEGGAYGHMAHIHETDTLKFGHLNQMISDIFTGGISAIKEKVDGQALAVSIDDKGQIVFARNKGQLKNFGANGMKWKDVAEKFKDRGDLTDAFTLASKDLTVAFDRLSSSGKKRFFNTYTKDVNKINTRSDDNTEIYELMKTDFEENDQPQENVTVKPWLNFEIVWPETTNVINYGKRVIIFHNFIAYDVDGNPRDGDFQGFAERLRNYLDQKNLRKQETFEIDTVKLLNFAEKNVSENEDTQNNIKDFENNQHVFINRLKNLQQEFSSNGIQFQGKRLYSDILSDNNTLYDYHSIRYKLMLIEGYFPITEFLSAQELDECLTLFTTRWLFGDKKNTLSQIKQTLSTNVQHEKITQQVYDTFLEVERSPGTRKNLIVRTREPIRSMFTDVGVIIIQNMNDLLAINPVKAVKEIKEKIDDVLETAKQSPEDLKELERIVANIERSGGWEKIVPTEGVTFQWTNPDTKEKSVFKLTGLFGDINQILGWFKYNRTL